MIKIQNFKLVKKKKLTHDIYELVFEWKEEMEFKNGQFITFLLIEIWGRTYSILELKNKKITLLIKKREKKNWGRGGSKYICELKIGENLKWVWPAGYFLLQENENNKLFIWTGTWFVPLYNQINWAIKKHLNWKLMLIFWVRTKKDIFYLKQLEKLKQNNINFDYKIYLSTILENNFEKWYVTNYLTQKNIKKFNDFYLCWIPEMIKSSKKILKINWVKKQKIHTEKY